jgi:hypothetical protein
VGVRFYLGTHHAHWLKRVAVPLFVSHRRLLGQPKPPKTLPKALGPWALDSGGFTELTHPGQPLLAARWREAPESYVEAVHRYRDEIGNLQWASPQDWMCEPIVLNGGPMARREPAMGTGLTVAEHQHRTVENFLRLRELGPDLPFVPVLQGFELEEYVECIDLYRSAGVDLQSLDLVAVGSVCKRQNSAEIEAIFTELASHGLKLHGYGVKQGGLDRYEHLLASADSMAWSFKARGPEGEGPPLPGHDKVCEWHPRTGVKNCANCLLYALLWRLSDVVLRVDFGELVARYFAEPFDLTDGSPLQRELEVAA